MNNKDYILKITSIFFFLWTTHISLFSQIVLERKADNGKVSVTCGSTTTFTDDNTIDGILYADEEARTDQIILCPSSSSKILTITFSQFSIAAGDALEVYDGDLSEGTALLITSMTGNGVSQANGGWLKSSCDNSVNSSGCLSFIFKTDGDKPKSTGWKANVICEDNVIEVACAANVSAKDDCLNPSSSVPVTFTVPEFTSCGGTVDLMLNLSGCSSANLPSTVRSGQRITRNFPLGTHPITATLVGDPSKTCTFIISVDQGSIVCNDNVNASLQGNCGGFISIDGILESPCYGNGVSYTLETTVGKNKTLSKTINATSSNDLSHGLTIPSEDFNCGDSYEIKITRNIVANSCGGSTTTLSKSCTGTVRFDDNSPPVIHASAQSLTTCGELSEAEILEQLTYSVVDACDIKRTTINVGSFPRNFCSGSPNLSITIEAEDKCGNVAKETVTVQINRPTDFFLPTDTLLICGGNTEPAAAGYPLLDADGDGKGDIPIIENECNYIPLFTDIEVPECGGGKKILREWKIQDWCRQGTPISLGNQLILVKDTVAPIINCPSSTSQGSENNPYTVSTGQDCNGDLSLPLPSATDNCGDAIDMVLVKITNKHFPSRSFTEMSDLDAGKYFAEYRAVDACGNRSAICKLFFDVKNTGTPTALCTDQLNVSFATGSAEIPASAIDGGSFDNCSNVSISIKKEGGDWGNQINLSCSEAANNTKVYLRVVNTNGGENTCWSVIKDNRLNSPCNSETSPSVDTNTEEEEMEEEVTSEEDNQPNVTVIYDESKTSNIKGKIVTPANQTLQGVSIDASNEHGYQVQEQTSLDGSFSFDLPNNANYKLTLNKPTDKTNGVTVIDMVIIQRHILGIVPFTTAHQYFAADLNLSGGISTFDLVQLRRMILGIETSNPIPTWRFVEEELMHENASWSQTNLEVALPQEQTDQELTIMAIKVGDLNGNVNPNGLQVSAPRTAKPIYPIAVTNQAIKIGSPQRIPFEIDLGDLEGLQFQLTVNGAELLAIHGDFLTEQQYVLERNTLKICWDSWTNSSTTKKGKLELEVLATQPSQLQDIIKLETTSFANIALTHSQEEKTVALQFTAPLTSSVRVQPNPFTDKVTFSIPTEKQQTIQLRLFTLQGELLHEVSLLSQSGNNQLQLDRTFFPNSGIFFYQIQTESALFSDRIILQDR